MKTEEMQKLVFCLIIFISVIFAYNFFRLKTDNGLFTYDEYKYIEKAQKIISDNYSGKSINENILDPLSIVLAFTGEYKLAMRLFPYLFIVINLLLLYALSRKAHMSENHRIYGMIYVLLSPLFIYIHTTFNLPLVLLPLILTGTLMFLYNSPFFGLLFFLLALWVNPWSFFVIATFLLFTFQRLKETRKGFEIFAMLFIVLIFLLLKGFSLPSTENFLQIGKEYITDIGAAYGIGVFGIISAAIGLILFLRQKEKQTAQVWFFVLLLFFSLYDKFFLVFFDLVAAYFAGFAILKIMHGNWESGILKNYVTLLLFCGLVFSCGSYLNKSYKAGAIYEERISIDWVKTNLNLDGNLFLSHYDFGYLISSSGAVTFTDKDYYLNSKEKWKIIESNDIFMSRDLRKVNSFLKKNDIRYIWINRAMKNNLIWTKSDEGMLFILKNSASFRKRYDYLGVEIWEFLQPSG